jgi:extradiol dioxygenase family protein
MTQLMPFHLAIPVTDLQAASEFYGDHLCCSQGRSDSQWIDWNFFGHQLVTHLVEEMPSVAKKNKVDGDQVPIPHFGLVLAWQDWENLSNRLTRRQQTFEISPHIRFKGKVGEQATLFFYDPFGNALEFKAFKDLSQLFAN